MSLLDRYRPFLRYDSQESYFADSVATMTDSYLAGKRSNALKRTGGNVLAAADPDVGPERLTLEFLAQAKYPNGAEVSKDDYLDVDGKQYVADARRMHAKADYADRVYGHEVADADGRRWLQYWFFYYYNDKSFLGVGLHEGDWEMVQLGLDAHDNPELVTLSQHKGGQACSWADLELGDADEGSAPVIYVARGSHANHIAKGEYEAPVVPDYCDARGPLVRPTLVEMGDDGPGWGLWPGVWGSTKARSALESNSPTGPCRHGPWKDPAAYHAKAHPTAHVRALAQAAQAAPAPPAPVLEARREGDRAVIAYSFPALEPGQPAPAKVVLTLDSPDDKLPPATYTYDVTGRTGAEEHPRALEDKRYEIRASAYDEEGHGSQTVSVKLDGEGAG